MDQFLSRRRSIVFALILFGAMLGLVITAGSTGATARGNNQDSLGMSHDVLGSTAVLTPYAYLPIVLKADPCASTGETYGSLTVNDYEPAIYPAETHPDINLAMRGYTPTGYLKGLIDLGGNWTVYPPQLAGVFSPPRSPNILQNYQVYGWDWQCMCRMGPISPPEDPEVTLFELAAGVGETVHLPDRPAGGDPDPTLIGGEYKALVLYVGNDRITLKYTRDDHVIWGYAIHLENVCVDPNLKALYTTLNNAGRHSLPALKPGQALGRARTGRVGVVIRDVGTFMDPRARYDWWVGY